ncbi:uncharacterized protein LOC143470085 [Clavelina lepadiformis]|uniref:uncharacterized protein LOC143470085 n=1 Tax=Clavelina lepadiformis TaxID=159417 RepID=UPI0040431DDF
METPEPQSPSTDLSSDFDNLSQSPGPQSSEPQSPSNDLSSDFVNLNQSPGPQTSQSSTDVTSVETPLHSSTWSFSSPSQFVKDSGIESTSANFDADIDKLLPRKYHDNGLCPIGPNSSQTSKDKTHCEPYFPLPIGSKRRHPLQKAFMTSESLEPSWKVPEGNPLARDLTDVALRFRHTERNSFNPFQGNMRTKNFSQTKTDPSQRLNFTKNLQLFNLPECHQCWNVTGRCSFCNWEKNDIRYEQDEFIAKRDSRFMKFFASPDDHPNEGQHRFVQYGQEEQKPKHTVESFKTEICKLWLKGHCHHGSVCHFAHGPKELWSKNDQLRQ